MQAQRFAFMPEVCRNFGLFYACGCVLWPHRQLLNVVHHAVAVIVMHATCASPGTRAYVALTPAVVVQHIGDATIADAMLDRLMQNNHRFTLTGESMRKKTVTKVKASAAATNPEGA